MSSKLIIRESQYIKLLWSLNEDNFYSHVIDKLVSDLDMNYEPIFGTVRDSGEYFDKPMLKIKVSGEMVSPRELLEYFSGKYAYSTNFIRQVITDWMFGNINNGGLTKNVSIN